MAITTSYPLKYFCVLLSILLDTDQTETSDFLAADCSDSLVTFSPSSFLLVAVLPLFYHVSLLSSSASLVSSGEWLVFSLVLFDPDAPQFFDRTSVEVVLIKLTGPPRRSNVCNEPLAKCLSISLAVGQWVKVVGMLIAH